MKLIKPAMPPLLFLFTPQADAGTYKWIDKDGSVVYSQHPPAEGPFESIHIKETPAAKQAAPGKQPNAVAQTRESGAKQGRSGSPIRNEKWACKRPGRAS